MSILSTIRADFNGLSFEEDSRAVIACDGDGHGCILYAEGAHIRFEIEELGIRDLDKLGLDDAPKGLSVWIGKYLWTPGGFECPEDGEMNPSGRFCKLTDDQWNAIRNGCDPLEGSNECNECNECNGSGCYFIDREPQVCICAEPQT